MKNSLSKLFILVAFAALAACSTPSKLSFNPAVGEDYKYVTETDMNMDIMGSAIDILSKAYFTYTINEKQDTAFKIMMVYDSMMISQDNPMTGKIEYNSNTYDPATADQTTQAIASAYEKIQDATISLWVNERGKVVKKEGMEDISGNQGMMQGGMGGATEMTFIRFPEGELKEGQTWTETSAMAGLPVEATTKYTVKSLGSEEIILDIESSVEEGKEAEMTGMEMKINSLKNKGEMIIERATGMVISVNSKMDMEMEMKTQGMNIAAITTGTTTLKRINQ